jgi:hypothetical protein
MGETGSALQTANERVGLPDRPVQGRGVHRQHFANAERTDELAATFCAFAVALAPSSATGPAMSGAAFVVGCERLGVQF